MLAKNTDGKDKHSPRKEEGGLAMTENKETAGAVSVDTTGPELIESTRAV